MASPAGSGLVQLGGPVRPAGPIGLAPAERLRYCAYLSVALLVGLGANALFGWWWADPLAALVIAAVAFKEGRESWRGEGWADGCC
jgi:hypothetical protein